MYWDVGKMSSLIYCNYGNVQVPQQLTQHSAPVQGPGKKCSTLRGYLQTRLFTQVLKRNALLNDKTKKPLSSRS